MKEKEVAFLLSTYTVGMGISPTGIETRFEEREILEVVRIGDDYETKSIVTITGYLNDTIEMDVKWNEDELETYKHNQKVLDLVRRGKAIIRDNLKVMTLSDEIEWPADEDVYSQLEITSYDRNEYHLFISIKGVDEKELAEFGGLDVQVKAVKHLIQNISRLDFSPPNDNYPTERKTFALYINEIGELMRNLSLDQEKLKELSNMDLVKRFMDQWQEESEIVAIIEIDNEEIRKEVEGFEMRQRMINDVLNNKVEI
jgi:hypothetical protein